MNHASQSQLRMVAGKCQHFNNKGVSANERDISCGICENWNGAKCKIGVFDDVLTSLDQT